MKKLVLPAIIAAAAVVVISLSRQPPVGAVVTTPAHAATNATKATASMPSATPAPPRKIDLDLVRMSKTMRDAWSVKIIEQPEELVGKMVRICGDFCSYDDGEGRSMRYVCALKDAAGCCAVGEVEFRLRGEYEWPKDFPEDFTPVTVSGCLEIARNGDGEARPRLTDADMEWKAGK